MTNFDKITQELDDTHYFDKESWFKDILKTNYDEFCDENFGVIFEIIDYKIFKVAHSRGGIRFHPDKITIIQYKEFLEKLKIYLKKNNFIFLGFNFMQSPNEFTNLFHKSNYKEHIYGTAIINVKADWLNKFNSKKKYDLLNAEKKGCKVKFRENNELTKEETNLIYSMMSFTIQRHKSRYTLIPFDVFCRIINYEKNLIGLVYDIDDNLIAFNIILFNPKGNKAERLFSSVNELGLKYRAAGFLEVKTVEKLYEKGIKKYDLWGISGRKDGVEVFKTSIADEIVQYPPYYGIIRVNIIPSILIENFAYIKSRLTFAFNQLKKNFS